jgi:hypothetical protein
MAREITYFRFWYTHVQIEINLVELFVDRQAYQLEFENTNSSDP